MSVQCVIVMKNTSLTCSCCYLEGEDGHKLRVSGIYLEEKGSHDNFLFSYVIINVHIFILCLCLEIQTENGTLSYKGYQEFIVRFKRPVMTSTSCCIVFYLSKNSVFLEVVKRYFKSNELEHFLWLLMNEVILGLFGKQRCFTNWSIRQVLKVKGNFWIDSSGYFARWH